MVLATLNCAENPIKFYFSILSLTSGMNNSLVCLLNRWAGPAGKGNPLPKNALTPDDVAAAILTIVNQVFLVQPSPSCS